MTKVPQGLRSICRAGKLPVHNYRYHTHNYAEKTKQRSSCLVSITSNVNTGHESPMMSKTNCDVFGVQAVATIVVIVFCDSPLPNFLFDGNEMPTSSVFTLANRTTREPSSTEVVHSPGAPCDGNVPVRSASEGTTLSVVNTTVVLSGSDNEPSSIGVRLSPAPFDSNWFNLAGVWKGDWRLRLLLDLLLLADVPDEGELPLLRTRVPARPAVHLSTPPAPYPGALPLLPWTPNRFFLEVHIFTMPSSACRAQNVRVPPVKPKLAMIMQPR